MESPRCARRRARHRRARDAGLDSRRGRARCARSAHASATRTRAGGGPDTSAGLEDVIRRAKAAGLFDEEARSAAALASRLAFAGELDKAADVADSLLELSRAHGIPGAAVDAWQTLAVVRQARGDVGAALEARRSAARAAADAGLKTREATLTINVGFALTTMGAKEEARVAIEGGIALAQAVGSPGTVRHGQMNLLCWVATFGPETALDALLADPRAIADNAVSGAWVPHDRATLGVLYYRGAELLRNDPKVGAAAGRVRARTHRCAARARPSKRARSSRRPPADIAQRRCSTSSPSRSGLGRGRAPLRRSPIAPSRSRPRPRACSSTARRASSTRRRSISRSTTRASTSVDPSEAKDAIARGLPRLVTRVHGLSGTPYAKEFLRHLAPNAGLIAAAEAYGLLPAEIVATLARE